MLPQGQVWFHSSAFLLKLLQLSFLVWDQALFTFHSGPHLSQAPHCLNFLFNQIYILDLLSKLIQCGFAVTKTNNTW